MEVYDEGGDYFESGDCFRSLEYNLGLETRAYLRALLMACQESMEPIYLTSR